MPLDGGKREPESSPSFSPSSPWDGWNAAKGRVCGREGCQKQHAKNAAGGGRKEAWKEAKA